MLVTVAAAVTHRHTFCIELGVLGLAAVTDNRTAGGCVLEQELIKPIAWNLVRLRLWHFDRARKISVAFTFAVVAGEARTPLPYEAGGGHGLGGANLFEHAVDPRQLRFTDVESRKRRAFEQHDRMSALRESRSRGGSAGTAADDRNVEGRIRSDFPMDLRQKGRLVYVNAATRFKKRRRRDDLSRRSRQRIRGSRPPRS